MPSSAGGSRIIDPVTRTAAILLAIALGASAASVNNPLLEKSFRIPFDRIGAANIEPGITSLLAQAGKNRAAYVANTSAPTY